MKSKSMNRLLAITCFVLCSFPALSQELHPLNRPVVVRAVSPIFPHIAAVARLSGVVVVDVLVNNQGRVTSAKTVEGDKLLGAVSELAAKHWVFAASEASSERKAILSFEFKLMPDETPSEGMWTAFVPPYKVEIKSKIPEVIDSPNVDPPSGRKRARPGRKNK